MIASLDIQLLLEVESENYPEEITPIILPQPKNLKYMSLAEWNALANDTLHRG